MRRPFASEPVRRRASGQRRQEVIMVRRTPRSRKPPPKVLSLPTSQRTELCYAFYHGPLSGERVKLHRECVLGERQQPSRGRPRASSGREGRERHPRVSPAADAGDDRRVSVIALAGGDESLLSFAAVTDDPPAEIAAAGQDRCIIPIKPANVDAWLQPQVTT